MNAAASRPALQAIFCQWMTRGHTFACRQQPVALSRGMAARRSVRLGAQGFEGSPLDRTVLSNGETIPDDVASHAESRFLPLIANRPLVLAADEHAAPQPAWLTAEELHNARARVAAAVASNAPDATAAAATGTTGSNDGDLDLDETYLLGRQPDDGFRFAALLGPRGAAGDDVDKIVHAAQLPDAAQPADMRALMRTAGADTLAVVGHAVALASWHSVRRRHARTQCCLACVFLRCFRARSQE